jgi:hypothetical protein
MFTWDLSHLIVKEAAAAADITSMQERRSEVRMLCADMVEVCWKDQAGRMWKETGLLEDICASGACLQMETAVPLEAEIHWESPQQAFTGRVRYCVYREIGYFIGVEFEPESRWSREKYQPQHLLDLQRLMEQGKK